MRKLAHPYRADGNIFGSTMGTKARIRNCYPDEMFSRIHSLVLALCLTPCLSPAASVTYTLYAGTSTSQFRLAQFTTADYLPNVLNLAPGASVQIPYSGFSYCVYCFSIPGSFTGVGLAIQHQGAAYDLTSYTIDYDVGGAIVHLFVGDFTAQQLSTNGFISFDQGVSNAIDIEQLGDPVTYDPSSPSQVPEPRTTILSVSGFLLLAMIQLGRKRRGRTASEAS